MRKAEASNNTMKILYINTSFYGGGAEKVMRQLYAGMKKDYEIDAYCVVGWEKHFEKEVHVIYKNFFRKAVNVVLRGRSESARLHDRYAVKRIMRIIHKYQIDLVHFHNITGNYFGIMDMKKIAKECPVVWTLHDMWAVTGHCAYALDCQEWKLSNKVQCGNCRDLKCYPKVSGSRTRKLFDRKRKTYANRNISFVTPSRWLENVARESFLKQHSVNTIENGVNCDIYRRYEKKGLRRKNKLSTNKLILLAAATGLNNPYKGIEVLVEALNKCKCKNNILLITVGSGSINGLDKDLEVIPKGIIKDEKKMNELYALADAFIISSKAENYPCSVLESMASGTPVIGSDVGGIPEQIEEGTGWLFQPGNSDQLKKIIEEIVEGKYDLEEYSNKCRSVALEKHNEKIMLEKYHSLYLEVLKNEKNMLYTAAHAGRGGREIIVGACEENR